MHNHRVNELLELLKPYWLKEPTLSLMQTLQKISKAPCSKRAALCRIKGGMFCRLPANTAKQLVSHRFASDKLAARYETSCFAIGICTAVRAKVGEAA